MQHLWASKLLIRAIARKKYIKYDGDPVKIFTAARDEVGLYVALRDADFSFFEQVDNYQDLYSLREKLNVAFKERHLWKNQEDWRTNDALAAAGFNRAGDWLAIVGMINEFKVPERRSTSVS